MKVTDRHGTNTTHRLDDLDQDLFWGKGALGLGRNFELTVRSGECVV